MKKYILKKSFSNNLPMEIINRPKQPYRAPEALALMNKKITEKFFNEDTIRSQNFFDWTMLSKLYAKIKKNNPILVSMKISFL